MGVSSGVSVGVGVSSSGVDVLVGDGVMEGVEVGRKNVGVIVAVNLAVPVGDAVNVGTLVPGSGRVGVCMTKVNSMVGVVVGVRDEPVLSPTHKTIIPRR